ncbi:hypothetical protein BS47DRAFT_1164745 [Hydnum rufescens UP504]|uniref:Uncharacterized protein n=1 Tax=Hydnum rufescens UP504 TaxID=1448309 RepID=A0A9P6DUC8_9AGAM|nr:hypothetical protein BS47DRAFT_1164745 [Hydnum rufescens UP504]
MTLNVSYPSHPAPRIGTPSILPFILVPITLSCLGLIFILFRHANGIKRVVQHRLNSLTGRGGAIRLEDDDDDISPIAVPNRDVTTP